MWGWPFSGLNERCVSVEGESQMPSDLSAKTALLRFYPACSPHYQRLANPPSTDVTLKLRQCQRFGKRPNKRSAACCWLQPSPVAAVLRMFVHDTVLPGVDDRLTFRTCSQKK